MCPPPPILPRRSSDGGWEARTPSSLRAVFLNFIISTRKCLQAKHLPKITESGLYFSKTRPETHFLRDFIIIWLSVELADRAKIWRSHPRFRYWTSVFSDEHSSKSNVNLNFPFPGFVLLENNQICTFYVNLWEDMSPLESQIFAVFLFILFPSFKQTVPSHFFKYRRSPKWILKAKIFLNWASIREVTAQAIW